MLHVSESEMAKIRPGSVHKIIIFKLEHLKKEGAENLSLCPWSYPNNGKQSRRKCHRNFSSEYKIERYYD